MPEAERRDSASSAFKQTGFIFASFCGMYIILVLAARSFFADNSRLSTVDGPRLAAVGVAGILFLFSALSSRHAWIQPFILYVLTPLPMVHNLSSLFSLGNFVCGTVMLMRLGFFDHDRFARMLICIAYFYLCEILIGIGTGAHPLDVLGPLLYSTVFLAVLLLVYRDKWVIYLRKPKPTLSLTEKGISKTERIYLRKLLEGRTVKAIAFEEEVTESTVRNTLARIYRKFGVPDKSALLATCEKFDIVD